MVGTAVLGHSTLAVHQETVPATLFRQGCLVTLSNEGVQLSLLTADGLHKLLEGLDTFYLLNNILCGTFQKQHSCDIWTLSHWYHTCRIINNWLVHLLEWEAEIRKHVAFALSLCCSMRALKWEMSAGHAPTEFPDDTRTHRVATNRSKELLGVTKRSGIFNP